MTHDQADGAGELAAKLAARSRHVCMLIGAGTSLAAGYPDVAGLRQRVLDELRADHPLVTDVFNNRNLEEGLNWLRRVAALLAPGEAFGPMGREEAIALDRAR